MKKFLAIPFVFPLLSSIAFATTAPDVQLVGIGTMDASLRDLSSRTAAPLESGEPGNLLGGMGSGLAYAGGNTYLALPDRGPNASTWNASVDNTTSFIPRFHSVQLDVVPNPSYDPLVAGSLPMLGSLHVTSTTLLSSTSSLYYAAGNAPSLNTALRYYFSSRSDNFNPATVSTSKNDARLDPESIRVSNDGKSVFISDEYGPYVYRFNRFSGVRNAAYALPSYYAASSKSAIGNDEISGNAVGRTANKGMEGLAITPDGNYLVGMMQASLRQDASGYLRLVKINIATKAVQEYAYQLTDGSGVSDLLAVSNTQFLALERDGKGLGDNSDAKVKKLYLIDLAGATEITGTTAITAGTASVSKTLFLDIVAALTANGIAKADMPSKMEGIAFGPDMVVDGETRHTLVLSNDNDFLPTVTDSKHPAGISNPNRFYIFAVNPAFVPAYTPQPVMPHGLDARDRG